MKRYDVPRLSDREDGVFERRDEQPSVYASDQSGTNAERRVWTHPRSRKEKS